MININPNSVGIQKTLSPLNKEDKLVTKKVLHELALRSDEAHTYAYRWVKKNWGREELDTWQSQHHKNKRAIEDAEAAVKWKDSLTPFQKLGRKILGEEKELSKKFPHWLVGEKDHPKTEQIKDARLSQELADTFGYTSVASALPD